MRTFISCGVACAALAVGVLMASCGPASAATNLVKNGSFEVPAVPAGDFRLFSTGQAFSGWRVVGVKGNVAVISGKYQGGGIIFNSNGLDAVRLSRRRGRLGAGPVYQAASPTVSRKITSLAARSSHDDRPRRRLTTVTQTPWAARRAASSANK
jgi:hypothetical protein